MIKDDKAFEAAIDQYAENELRLQQFIAKRDAKIQQLREMYAGDIEPLQEQNKALLAGTRNYAKKFRNRLFLKGRRSSESTLAEFGFRMGTERVAKPAKLSWDKVVHNAIKHGLQHLLRIKHDLNKEKVIAEATQVEKELLGIEVKQTESFWIKPKDPGAAKSNPNSEAA